LERARLINTSQRIPCELPKTITGMHDTGDLQLSKCTRNQARTEDGHVRGTSQIMPDGRIETITGFTFRLAENIQKFKIVVDLLYDMRFLKRRSVRVTSPVARKKGKRLGRRVIVGSNLHPCNTVKSRMAKNRNPSEYEIAKFAGCMATEAWKSQDNPGPVYVAGYRVHHGAVGLALIIGGLCLKSDAMLGFGEALVIDDMDDASEWFNFEAEPPYKVAYG